MVRDITNILIPVDFSVNTEVALSKALELGYNDARELTIHLLHSQRIEMPDSLSMIYHVFTGYTQRQINDDIEASKRKLELLKQQIQEKRKNTQVLCWVIYGERAQDCIVKKARSLAADLIIIGKQSHHTFFPFLNTVIPSKVAATTAIPVLTVKPGSLNQEIKTVVIPLDPQFPVSKLKILEAFRFRSRSRIRLVMFRDSDTEKTRHCLVQTFRVLKSHLSNQVDYEVLDGRNKGKALIKYCKDVSADMLIVYHGAETRVNGWPDSHISDHIPAGSRTQVLAVSPR